MPLYTSLEEYMVAGALHLTDNSQNASSRASDEPKRSSISAIMEASEAQTQSVKPSPFLCALSSHSNWAHPMIRLRASGKTKAVKARILYLGIHKLDIASHRSTVGFNFPGFGVDVGSWSVMCCVGMELFSNGPYASARAPLR